MSDKECIVGLALADVGHIFYFRTAHPYCDHRFFKLTGFSKKGNPRFIECIVEKTVLHIDPLSSILTVKLTDKVEEGPPLCARWNKKKKTWSVTYPKTDDRSFLVEKYDPSKTYENSRYD